MSTRVTALGLVLVTALLLTTVVGPVVTVAGVRPDLVLLSVLAVALADGAGTGVRYGFCAGLAVDLLSGSAQLVGVSAFTLLVIGYLAGLVRPYIGASGRAGEVAVVAGGTALAVVVTALLGLLLDATDQGARGVVRDALGLALYHVLLAPAVLGPVARLCRRFDGTVAATGATWRDR